MLEMSCLSYGMSTILLFNDCINITNITTSLVYFASLFNFFLLCSVGLYAIKCDLEFGLLPQVCLLIE